MITPRKMLCSGILATVAGIIAFLYATEYQMQNSLVFASMILLSISGIMCGLIMIFSSYDDLLPLVSNYKHIIYFILLGLERVVRENSSFKIDIQNSAKAETSSPQV